MCVSWLRAFSPRRFLSGARLVQPAKRVYYHLFFAQILALVSTGVATVALALLAYDLAGADAGAVLGTALAIKMGTYVVVAPVAAAFSERLPRRALLIGLDLVRAAVALALPFVTRVWEVYALIFLFQAASAAFTPAFQATIPDLLPDEKDYTQALARSRLAHELEGVVSPMLATALLLVISSEGLFVATTMGFLASAALIVAVALPTPIAAIQGGFTEGTTRGLRLYLATPRLRGLLALNLAVAAATAMVVVNTVVLVQLEFGLSERATTIGLATFGTGSVIAALALPRLLDDVADRTVMLAGAGLVAGGLLVGALASSHHLMLLLWFGLGLGCATALTPAGCLLRRSAGPKDRPALYAAQFALAHACLLITYPLAGWLGVTIGLSWTFAVLGLVAAAAVLVAIRLWPHADSGAGEHLHVRPEDPLPVVQ